MPAKINFKQSALTRSIHRILKINHINKLVYTNVFLSIFTASVYAQEEPIPTYRPESKPVLTSRSEAKGQPEDDQDEIAAAPSMTEQELQK